MRLPRWTQPGGRQTTFLAEIQDGSALRARPAILRLDYTTGSPHRGPHDVNMRAATAQIIAQRFKHFGFGRVRGAHQQRLGGHDHAIEAIAALRGLFPDEGVLHRIGTIARAKTFERHNVALDAAADRNHAGACRDAVDKYGASAAFAEP